jgi:predicted phosphodiesterase
MLWKYCSMTWRLQKHGQEHNRGHTLSLGFILSGLQRRGVLTLSKGYSYMLEGRRQNSYLKIEENYDRLVVCGDIHGCYDELMSLLKKVNLQDDDLLVCAGDMIDRGPRTWDVVEYFQSHKNAYCVLGNHELRLSGYIQGYNSAAWSQKQSLSLLEKEKWQEMADWLGDLPVVIETRHAIIVHGRLDPENSITNQDPVFACAVGGSNVNIATDESGAPSWIHKTRLDKPVCIGHRKYYRVDLVPKRLYGLDEKVHCGGFLTAVIFPGGEVKRIESGGDYKRQARILWELEKLEEEEKILHWRLEKACRLGAIPDLSLCWGQRGIRARRVFKNLGLMDMAFKSRQRLIEIFGFPPEAGEEKETYYKYVKETFDNKLNRRLAANSLSGRLLIVEHLPGIIGKTKTVIQAQDEMKAFLKEIDILGGKSI